MNTWVNFAAIRQKVSLEDVITRYYKIEGLKKDGTKLIGACPVHGGDSPRSFHAELDRSIWHCFTKCQRGGNQLDFVALKENITIRDAALRLQAFFLGGGAAPPAVTSRTPHTEASRHVETPSTAPAVITSHKTEADDEANPALEVKLDLKPDHPHLIEERKLKPQTIEHFGIGYCSRGIMRGCIAIPIHDELGALVAYAGRRLKATDIKEYGKYRFPKGFKKDLVLFNYHRAAPLFAEQGLIVVEGFFSVMKLHEMGIDNVVALMGCALSAPQAKLLAESPTVVLLLDGNEAGWAGAAAAREQLASKTNVRSIRLPLDLEPEDLPPDCLSWIMNGIDDFKLAEIALTFDAVSSQPRT